MKNAAILLAHGAGGYLSHQLIAELFLPFLGNPVLSRLDDSALLTASGTRLALTTDSYVVKPLFFPGGDIGRLSLCGTVNDLAMMGAAPMGIAASFILEEGFPTENLERILGSLKAAAQEAGVEVVAGDTKVVERGKADGMFITTSGVGVVPAGVAIQGRNAVQGDAVMLSGPVGDHEAGILLARGEFSLEGTISSDCAPLNHLVDAMLGASKEIHVLRDPTRGGLATVLWEIATGSKVGLEVVEEMIQVRPEVRGVCDLLGFDPLYLANEGKLVAVVPENHAGKVLSAMKRHPLGRSSAIIGRVVAEHPGRVLLKTRIGGHRLLEPLSGEQFPRIC
jgi:hydrogenase expression/formation protein HypE